MLIPCPGPQFTLCINTPEHPVCMEMQSSPAKQRKICGVDENFFGVLEVDSICVGAISRRRDIYVKDLNSNAVVEFEVCLRAILNCYASNCYISTFIKPKCLKISFSMFIHSKSPDFQAPELCGAIIFPSTYRFNNQVEKFTWITTPELQFVPKNVMGLTKNTDPDGTSITDPCTLQASVHAAANACQECHLLTFVSSAIPSPLAP